MNIFPRFGLGKKSLLHRTADIEQIGRENVRCIAHQTLVKMFD